jgi:type IV pilus assembly protein PilE
MNIQSHKTILGFSLPELIIILMVIAILAVIALPSYQEQLRKSRRVDAVVALIDLANRLERNYSELNAYPQNAAEVAAFLPTTAANSPQGYYQLSFQGIGTASTATTFKIQATRISTGLQANDNTCGDYTLTDQGVRAITGTGTLAQCWPGGGPN